MPGEDQERFEDYLDLENFIAQLQAGHVTHPLQELTPAQARIYRMATQFHAASSGFGEPRPEFAAQLQLRLEAELQAQQDTQKLPKIQMKKALTGGGNPQRRISRRMLLTGSAAASVAVGAAAAGAAMEHMLDQTAHVPTGSVTKWFSVATVAELQSQAIKFMTDDLIGYVVRCDGTQENSGEQGEIIAVSAACPHKGCIVQWQADRKFHCPCHGGVFTEDGGIDHYMSSLTLDSLPRLDVLVQDGQIYVRMPKD
ncbi:MAG: ubiquinol-cytochrome c reductase iron-sulfur subunit [Ktedonobacteraceae bacterium]